MPEYLSPGVYIEEIPARLKAIEGVSTSTAGFVGAAERGTVPGYPLPAITVPVGQTFEFPIDRGPVLTTSFAEFTRNFGGTLPLVREETHGYLARAVRGFFDNGGRRCFVTRVVHFDANNLGNSATRSVVRIHQGTILRLAQNARRGQAEVVLTSLRHINRGGTANGIAFFRQNGTPLSVGGPFTVNRYDTRRGSITLNSNLTEELDRDEVFAIPEASVAAPAGPPGGPQFFARTAGAWSEHLSVAVLNSDGPPIPVAQAVTGPFPVNTITVDSAAGLYVGAIVEVDHGAFNTVAADRIRTYHEVTDITGNVLTLNPPLADTVNRHPNPPPPAPFAAGNPDRIGGFVRLMEIDVVVEDGSGPARVTEVYRRLCWNERNDPRIRARHYSTVVNARSRLVYVLPPWADAALGGAETNIDEQPMTANGFEMRPVAPANVGEDNYDQITDDDYEGVDNGPGQRTGIQSLQDIEDIRIVAAPGQTAVDVQNALIAQCERMRYRFAVLDGEAEPDATAVITAILAHRNAYDTSYAAYYTPWIADREGGQTIFLPPSGHVAGIYARVDNDRGVWKAPANEVVRSATGLAAYITTGEQDILNPRGVNAIRRFEGRGIRVWGARTLSSDPEFRYVNVRRFLIYLETSLDRGTQWVVFEPNAPETWSRVTDSVSAFLHTQWRTGALFGRRPEDAFFVRCDETTMTADDVQNGRLICEIGVAIVRPAEFVIFRIEQITGFARQS